MRYHLENADMHAAAAWSVLLAVNRVPGHGLISLRLSRAACGDDGREFDGSGHLSRIAASVVRGGSSVRLPS
jgi:hypothetical protein